MIWTRAELGWPWSCLGGSLVMFALMFGTSFMRAHQPSGSRWRDPIWLAWLLVPVLMFHMFEEYGYDVLGRAYFLAGRMCASLGYTPYPNCPIPRAHYPLLNLGMAWLSAPIAASLARRNLMIGLSLYGLLLVNGLLHVIGALTTGSDGLPGAVTGALFFIPLPIWVCYAVIKARALSGGALAMSLAGGVITHIALIGVLQAPKFSSLGESGILLLDCVVIMLGPTIAGLGSLLFESSMPGPGSWVRRKPEVLC